MSLRVVKLGGSLLSRRTLAEDVRRWLGRQTPAATLVIVGGGPLIEAFRTLDRIHALDATAMHWRCVAALRSTFEIVAERFPEWRPVEDLATIDRGTASPVQLLPIDRIYHPGAGAPLPCDWRTTTDAIAAWIAQQLNASEAVLLKSCPIPSGASLEQLAAAGIVDDAISKLAPRPVIRLEDLAAPSHPSMGRL
jgi:aspartokinase-like uncharacterized kinase